LSGAYPNQEIGAKRATKVLQIKQQKNALCVRFEFDEFDDKPLYGVQLLQLR